MTRRPSSVEAQLRSLSSVLHPPSPFLPLAFPFSFPHQSPSHRLPSQIASHQPLRCLFPLILVRSGRTALSLLIYFESFGGVAFGKSSHWSVCVCLEWDSFVESTSGIFVVVPGLVVCFGDEL